MGAHQEERVDLVWEYMQEENGNHRARRAKVPGGWLVSLARLDGCGATFVPDPGHTWKLHPKPSKAR